MMHLVPFWALGKCFFFLLFLNLCFIVYIGCNLLTMGQVKKTEASNEKRAQMTPDTSFVP